MNHPAASILICLLAGAVNTAPAQPVVLRFGGDVMLSGYYESAVGENITAGFRDLDLLRTADLSMVNLEHPITVRGERVEKPYNFRMHPRNVHALADAGIDLACIANNHVFDYGPLGLLDTYDTLAGAGIIPIGAGRNRREAHAGAVKEVRGMKIGFLAYYRGGEAPAARDTSPGVADREPAAIRRDIRRMKDTLGAELVIVNIHWGTEKADTPDTWQRRLAHLIIDTGADVIVGHHPHVLQGIERYRHGIIAYSLGNLLFGGNSRDTYDTALLEIRAGPTGFEHSLLPVRVRDWRAAPLSGPGATAVLQHVDRLSRIFPPIHRQGVDTP